MSETRSALEVQALGLAGTGLEVYYRKDSGEPDVFQSPSILLSRQGIAIEWPNSPKGLDTVQLEWTANPFMARPFRCECRVSSQDSGGIEVEFEGPPPAALEEWLRKTSAYLNRRPPDAAVTTSKLYTTATVVSSFGLFCGALAILLPLLLDTRAWVDLLSKVLLLLMVASIGGFALIRALAGRAEVKAISQG